MAAHPRKNTKKPVKVSNGTGRKTPVKPKSKSDKKKTTDKKPVKVAMGTGKPTPFKPKKRGSKKA